MTLDYHAFLGLGEGVNVARSVGAGAEENWLAVGTGAVGEESLSEAPCLVVSEDRRPPPRDPSIPSPLVPGLAGAGLSGRPIGCGPVLVMKSVMSLWGRIWRFLNVGDGRSAGVADFPTRIRRKTGSSVSVPLVRKGRPSCLQDQMRIQ
jgi:hypothetical protein